MSHDLYNVQIGSYQYLQDLLRLDRSSSKEATHTIQGIVTPLQVDAWAAYLRPSRRADVRLPTGLYSGGEQQQRPRNLGSARQHPEEVDRYIAREVRLQRVICVPPGVLGEIPTLRISPIGVIPKRNSPTSGG